jgi:hypothetical protein
VVQRLAQVSHVDQLLDADVGFALNCLTHGPFSFWFTSFRLPSRLHTHFLRLLMSDYPEFEPTSIGLPADFILTNFTKLKGFVFLFHQIQFLDLFYGINQIGFHQVRLQDPSGNIAQTFG